MEAEYQALVKSEQYKTFVSTHSDYELANVFILHGKQFEANWQFGYYSQEKDDIITFVVKKNGESYHIEEQAADEAMKKPDVILHEISLDDLKVSHEECVTKSLALLKELYQADTAQSQIILLQKDPEFGFIWNVTFVTDTWDVVNLKLDAVSAELKNHSKHSLLDMQANRV